MTFEKTIIQDTFERCWGLQSALQSGYKNDSLLFRGALESLVNNSGLRKEFIESNLEEILSWTVN